MTYQNFNDLIKIKPHEIHEVFISDLHLDEQSLLVDAFLEFLDLLATLPNLKKIYIIGDWFELWIGDDEYLELVERTGDKTAKDKHWITPIITKLKKMRIAGCETLVLTGNRDFLMRQPFCNTFAGEMLQEPYFITMNQQIYRLEHGDMLCTDDKNYQRFRKYAHNPIVQWWLLKKSIAKRLIIADKLRVKSKNANANKSITIMDVNQQAVMFAFNPHLDKQLIKICKKKNKPLPQSSDMIIHGHTHRPNIHKMGNNIRYVLGDWRLNTVQNEKKYLEKLNNYSLEKINNNSLEQTTKLRYLPLKKNVDIVQVNAVIGVLHGSFITNKVSKTPIPSQLHNTHSQPHSIQLRFELMEYYWKQDPTQ